MGLLGDSWDDPKSLATLQLAAGLLGPGNFGQNLGRGLTGYQASLAANSENDLRKAQLENVAAQAAERKQTLETQQRLQAFIASKFGGGGQAPVAPGPMSTSVMFSPEMNAARQGQMATPQPGQSAGGAPAFPLSFNEAVQLHTMGGPDLLPAWKTATEGLEQKPGSFYIGSDGVKRYNADPTKGVTVDAAGKVIPMPGGPETQATLAGAVADAQEAAKAKYDLVPSYDPKTRQPISIPRSQALGMGGPAAPPAAPQPLARPAPIPAATQTARDGDAAPIFQQELAAAKTRAASGDPRAVADVAAIQREMKARGIPEAAPAVTTAGNPTGPGQTEKNNTALDEKMIANMAADIQSSAEKTQAAQGTLQVASQLEGALKSGKVMAGPTAMSKVYLTQIGNVMGIAGDEGLTATRATIQNLAKLTLTARSSMKGQGSVSDFEGKSLAKAESGDIDNLTIPEIKAIVASSQRVAKLQVDQHAEMMKRSQANDWRSFYSQQGTPAAQAAKSVVKTGTYGGRKVVQYSDGSTAYAD